jgi:hypothetical protein
MNLSTFHGGSSSSLDKKHLGMFRVSSWNGRSAVHVGWVRVRVDKHYYYYYYCKSPRQCRHICRTRPRIPLARQSHKRASLVEGRKRVAAQEESTSWSIVTPFVNHDRGVCFLRSDRKSSLFSVLFFVTHGELISRARRNWIDLFDYDQCIFLTARRVLYVQYVQYVWYSTTIGVL